MKKILIIGPSWVGDMVMSQALYTTLKNQDPDCQIDVVAPDWCKPILERMPEVSEALTMPFSHGEFNFAGRRALGNTLRTKQYDHAYVLPNSAKSALIPWFANIPKRTGWKGEMRYGLLNDLRTNKKSFQYMVERYAGSLGGLETLPKPSLMIDKSAQKLAIEKYHLNTQSKVIGLCPGAEKLTMLKWLTRCVSKGIMCGYLAQPKISTLVIISKSKSLANLVIKSTFWQG